MARCDQATEMWLRWKDVELAHRVEDVDFNLYGWEDNPLVEGFSQFQYLDRTLNHTDNYWTALHQNIGNVQVLWRRLGNLLRQ